MRNFSPVTHHTRLAHIERAVIKPKETPVPTDPIEFARSIGFEPDPWQSQVLTSASKRICICAARQTGKTATVALLGLHTALTKNDALILILSPSIRQSQLLYQAVISHYNAAKRPFKGVETTLSLSLSNNSRIIALPGSEQTIRGYSACDLILCDESARIPDQLYYSSLPFLAVSNGSIILLSTPFGERGFFYDVYSGTSLEWERLLIPASECPRITDAFLKEQREQMGEYWFQSEYECAFLAPEAGLFTPDAVRAIFDNDLMEYDI